MSQECVRKNDADSMIGRQFGTWTMPKPIAIKCLRAESRVKEGRGRMREPVAGERNAQQS